MVDNQARDVGASGSAHEQEVRINAKLVTTHPRIPLSWFALEWRWSYTATLVPTRWIFISCSFLGKDLKHSQVDAEIEVVGETEKEAETEVSKCHSHAFSCFSGALSPSNILPIACSFRFDVASESESLL